MPKKLLSDTIAYMKIYTQREKLKNIFSKKFLFISCFLFIVISFLLYFLTIQNILSQKTGNTLFNIFVFLFLFFFSITLRVIYTFGTRLIFAVVLILVYIGLFKFLSEGILGVATIILLFLLAALLVPLERVGW